MEDTGKEQSLAQMFLRKRMAFWLKAESIPHTIK